jgi:hypothetical protein
MLASGGAESSPVPAEASPPADVASLIVCILASFKRGLAVNMMPWTGRPKSQNMRVEMASPMSLDGLDRGMLDLRLS